MGSKRAARRLPRFPGVPWVSQEPALGDFPEMHLEDHLCRVRLAQEGMLQVIRRCLCEVGTLGERSRVVESCVDTLEQLESRVMSSRMEAINMRARARISRFHGQVVGVRADGSEDLVRLFTVDQSLKK